jgi:hypothetical protein
MRHRVQAFVPSVLACAFMIQGVRAQDSSEVSDEAFRVREIAVHSANVFGPEEASRRPWLYGLVNRFHTPTREATIRREMWFAEGESINLEDAAELERYLRSTELFAAVDVQADEVSPGQRDIVVTTQDSLSLLPVIAPYSLGGLDGIAAWVTERNLLGTGDTLSFQHDSNSEDEWSNSLSYTDRHLMGSKMQLATSIGDSDRGEMFSLGLSQPLRSLRDPYFWDARIDRTRTEVQYFRSGLTVARVPRDRRVASGVLARELSRGIDRRSRGLLLSFEDTEYSPATGVEQGLIQVPGDISRSNIGYLHRFDARTRYETVTGLDSLDFVQDIQLGLQTETSVSLSLREELGVEDRTEALLDTLIRYALKRGDSFYMTFSGGLSTRYGDGRSQGWARSLAIHAFDQRLDRHTLAASLSYDHVFERSELTPQLILGEDTGVRGYPARYFPGRRRVRLNVEDRIDLDIEFMSFHVGAVAFFDAGWIGEADYGSPRRSVGVGLRFASSEILGRSVIRLDLAFPLDERPGEDFGSSVSFSIGQAFEFFGNL